MKMTDLATQVEDINYFMALLKLRVDGLKTHHKDDDNIEPHHIQRPLNQLVAYASSLQTYMNGEPS